MYQGLEDHGGRIALLRDLVWEGACLWLSSRYVYGRVRKEANAAGTSGLALVLSGFVEPHGGLFSL